MTALYPNLSTVSSISRHTENAIMSFSPVGKEIYFLLFKSIDWEKNYTIIHDVVGEFYWIKELKGIKFHSSEEARLYCFLDYCEKMGSNRLKKTHKRLLNET